MNKQFGKRILAVLAAAAVPFTTLLSSAPLVANAADGYITSQTTQTSLSSHINQEGNATLPDRSIANEDVVGMSDGKSETTDYIKGRTLKYTYTGNIYTATSSLYNYIADSGHNSIAEGYADPYVNLNKAIESTMNYKALYSPSSENLTIRFKSTMNGDKNVKVYLFNGSKDNVWDGAAMNYDSSKKEYVYTVKYDDIGFNPTGLIITGRNENNILWQTGDIYRNLEKGKTYFYSDKSLSDAGTAENLYKTSVPLYFGCFYREYKKPDGLNNTDGNKRFNDSFDQDISYNYGADNKGDKTYDGKNTNVYSDFYKNFYWQANLSFRGNYDGAVQGLVDNTLTDGTITQNGIKMPYFDKDWAKAHSDLVKYWDNVDFPFYEVKIGANKVHGDAGATGDAIYYQFNSRKDNLYFDQSKGKYKETDTQIKSQGTLIRDENGKKIAEDVRTVSYLPFNSYDSANGKDNDLGFGTYFDIKFKIRKDGKVDTVDGTGSVNATFEFMGDDDVWVFIDDKLVLDLGGDHKDTTGLIDFAEKKAYANDATKLGYNSNTGMYVGMDNLAKNITKQLTVNLEDVMAEGTFNADGTYNQNMTHTLRMFYMERGMYESDLFVRFNFSAIPNDSNLKIKEITNFKDINPGLVDLTKKAADYDVFNYSISNTGTSAEDVGKSGILSPTYNSYERDVLGQKTLLSGKDLAYKYDPNALYLDTSKKLSGDKTWDENKTIGAWIWRSGQGGVLYIGKKVGDHLYKFSDFPTDANNIKYLRLGGSGYVQGSTSWPSNVDNETGNSTFAPGNVYQITDWTASSYKEKLQNEVLYEEHDFIPDSTSPAVKNVNYIWTDEFASFTGTDKNGLTGTTDDLGSFRLMYGTDDKESSAEFKKQFTKASTMYVNQNDILQTVKGDGKVEDFSTTRSRKVSEYYDTTVRIADKNDNEIANQLSSNTDTKYSYDNTSAVNSDEPVQITETFINIPKTFSLEVKKELAPDDNVSDSFKFKLALTNIFGIKEINADSSTYANIDIIINGTKKKLGEDAEFTLQRNQIAVIEGIPYGTSYTVTEMVEADSNYEPKDNDNASGTVGQDEEGKPTNNDNLEVVTNTRKTGELKLEKKLEKNDETESGINNSSLFTFKVALTNTEVNLNDYKDGFKYQTSSMTDSVSIIGSTLVSYDEISTTFTAKVSVDEPVILSGLPYGTTYSVSEESVSDEWTSSVVLTGATAIGKESSLVTVTNTYNPKPKFGSLKVSKNVRGINSSEDIPQEMAEQKFNFTVTLFKGADALSGTFTTSKGSITFTDGSATFTLCDDESIVISNIPVGTVYTVEEEVNAEYDTTFEGADNGTIEDNVTAEVKFTNTKKFIPYTLPESGFEDTRMYFVFALSGMMLCGLAYFFINRKKISN